jgi:hypothetical protein
VDLVVVLAESTNDNVWRRPRLGSEAAWPSAVGARSGTPHRRASWLPRPAPPLPYAHALPSKYCHSWRRSGCRVPQLLGHRA